MKKIPTVSIGMFVRNDEKRIIKAIETIINQTFGDFELIISDNASTDSTEKICRDYENKDSRIKYFRQSKDIGGACNVVFVYRQAIGEFFMWAPSHYSRSLNFLEECIKLLKNDLNCNFVSTPNCWIGDEDKKEKHINFSLEGSEYERTSKLLDMTMLSHACFYGLFRRLKVEGIEEFKENYFASDILFMIKNVLKSEFKRTKNGLLVVGKGRSTSDGYIASWQTRSIHYILPLYEFTKDATSIILKNKNILFYKKIILFYKIILNNFKIYKHFLKYWLNKIKILKY